MAGYRSRRNNPFSKINSMSRRSSYNLYEELSNKNSEDESAKINNRNNYMYNSWISGSYDQSKCMECGNHSCICVRGCKGATGDGDVPIDNNASERAIRGFCIGKKNWEMIDTVNGEIGRASCRERV